MEAKYQIINLISSRYLYTQKNKELNYKKLLYIPIVILLFFAIIISCDNKNYISNQSNEIEKGVWLYKDQLQYDFNIQDTTKVYNLYLEIDHTTEYAYQNLYLKLHTLFPNGKKMEQQVSFELADKYGQWYGDCSSNSCSLLVDLQKGTYFNAIGKHTIMVEQFMRKNPIEGIEQLALKVEETGVLK